LKAYVAVTDNDWFRFLKQRPSLDEVNFWQPGGNRLFGTLQPNEPFLFKLHYPDNYIVGGGLFAHSSILPFSLAWDAFGEKNGAATIEQMRERIEKYRHERANPHEDYKVGCIILEQPFFFEERDWIPVPSDFAKNIVSGKSYDLSIEPGQSLWEQVQIRLRATSREHELTGEKKPIYGEPILVLPRLGQGSFRVLVTDVYQRRCAVTGEKALPVLEAAHIKPVSSQGEHSIQNGLLLRSDVHTLFDRGYVTVTPDFQFRVSRRLKQDFDNGEHYFKLNGHQIWVPPHVAERPSREALEWHTDTVFRG
jgi:putative restriction endonuclease